MQVQNASLRLFAGKKCITLIGGGSYGDAENDPAYPYQGLPKLENTHNWYEPKDKK